LPEAAASLTRATQLDPRSADAWQNLGTVQGLRGQLTAATESLTRATKLDQKHIQAHLDLGRVLHQQARAAEAIEHYRLVSQLRPGWSEPIARLAWILATNPDAAIRQPARAVRLAEEAAQLAIDQPTSIRDTLAAAYASAGRYQDAAATLRAAMNQLKPDDPLLPELRSRLALYAAGQPYREPLQSAQPSQRADLTFPSVP
jgi:tetratricopeptide (TPR) repeat protein